MSHLRVDPNQLRRAAAQIEEAQGALRALGSELLAGSSDAPSYEGQFGMLVSRWGMEASIGARTRARKLADLAKKLNARALAYEEADLQAQVGVEALGYGFPTSTDPALAYLMAAAAAERSELGIPKWLEDLLNGALLGDFSEDSSFMKLLAQVIVGFIPGIGQIADIRDILANLRLLIEGREGAWIGLALASLAIIPGLDALKGLRLLRPVFNALGDRGARELLEFVLRNPNEVGRVARVLGEIIDNPNVIEALAENGDVALRLIREGSPELVEAYAKYGDEVVEVALKYGDDGAYIAQNFDRYGDLCRDSAHSNNITSKSLNEAAVGLAVEGRGEIPGPIVRSTNRGAEFVDATGQEWDHKGFFSSDIPVKGSFELESTMEDIHAELALGENLIIDTQRMFPEHIEALREAVETAGILDDRILWYP